MVISGASFFHRILLNVRTFNNHISGVNIIMHLKQNVILVSHKIAGENLTEVHLVVKTCQRYESEWRSDIAV